MSNTAAFDRAIGHVNAERGKHYGHPADNFRRAAALRGVVNECSDPLLRQALGAITDKVARLIETPDHLDSWIDVAGYARCGCMILDRREQSRTQVVEDSLELAQELRRKLREDIAADTPPYGGPMFKLHPDWKEKAHAQDPGRAGPPLPGAHEGTRMGPDQDLGSEDAPAEGG